MKVSIIGSGMVGSTFAYRLVISHLATEIVLLDINKTDAEMEAEDLNHSMSIERSVRISAGDYSDIKNSDFVVITAGVAQKAGETRLALINFNAKIIKEITNKVKEFTPDCILIIASNPLDVMTYIALRNSGFPQNKVIGSGTVLDSSRFKYYLAQKLNTTPRDIFAYVLGEHGDSQVEIFSNISIKGLSLENYCREFDILLTTKDKEDIIMKTKNIAYDIIAGKGSTCYGIGSALFRIVRAIWQDEDSILPVSTLMQGQYGFTNICLSLPTILNKNGVKKTLSIDLNSFELQKLEQSAKLLKSYNKSVNL